MPSRTASCTLPFFRENRGILGTNGRTYRNQGAINGRPQMSASQYPNARSEGHDGSTAWEDNEFVTGTTKFGFLRDSRDSWPMVITRPELPHRDRSRPRWP